MEEILKRLLEAERQAEAEVRQASAERERLIQEALRQAREALSRASSIYREPVPASQSSAFALPLSMTAKRMTSERSVVAPRGKLGNPPRTTRACSAGMTAAGWTHRLDLLKSGND